MIGLTLGLVAASLGLHSTKACALSVGFTVVPPGPVSDRAEVEARVGLVNAADGEQQARVVISCDGRRLLTETVTVPPRGGRLVRTWWPAAGHAGAHVLSCRVAQGDSVVARGRWPLRVVPADTPALPVFQGGWLDFLGLLSNVYPRNRDAAEQDLRDVIDAMHGLGVGTVIVTYVEFQGRFFYPSRLRFHDRDMRAEAAGNWLPYDAVEAVLSQADRRGMHVFLGLGRGGDMGLMATGVHEPDRLRQAVGTSRSVAAELWERYRHHRSLYGWYLTHEMHDLASASAYYDPVADFCHALAPDKPVLVAPDGTPVTGPDTLAASHVDIFAYQDAVGAGYVPYEYTYDPERRLASLEQVYADYAQRHRGIGKHLWADLEIWEMAGPDYGNPYPPAWSRVARQLAIETRHVEMVTAYEFLGFMEAPGSSWRLQDRRAEALYRGYDAYRRGLAKTRDGG
jgi:hypothetical protein